MTSRSEGDANFSTPSAVDLHSAGTTSIDAAPHHDYDSGGWASETLQRICQDILQIAHVPSDEDLTTLGADSMQLLRIVGRARQEGIQIDIHAAFAEPRVGAMLAAAMEASAPPRLRAANEQPRSELRTLPLTYAQRTLLDVFDQPDSITVPVVLRLSAAVPADAVVCAAQDTVARHDSLWLAFAPDGTGWQQAPPYANRSIEIPVVGPISEANMWDRIRRTSWTISIESSPLCLVTLYRRADGEQFLHLVVHHLAIDAVGIEILLDDFEASLESALGLRTATAPAVSFWEWRSSLEQYYDSLDQRRVADEWASYVGRAKADSVPTDHDSGPNLLEYTSASTVSTPAEVTHRLREIASRDPTITLEGCLLAALGHGYSRSFDGQALYTMVSRSGRRPMFAGPDPSSVVGWLVFHFPILLPAASRIESGRAFAQFTSRRLADAPGGGLTYGLLARGPVDVHGASPDVPATPETWFIYHGDRDRFAGSRKLLQHADVPDGLSRPMAGRRTILFQVMADVVSDNVRLTVRYSRNHHRAERINEWLAHMQEYLTAL